MAAFAAGGNSTTVVAAIRTIGPGSTTLAVIRAAAGKLMTVRAILGGGRAPLQRVATIATGGEGITAVAAIDTACQGRQAQGNGRAPALIPATIGTASGDQSTSFQTGAQITGHGYSGTAAARITREGRQVQDDRRVPASKLVAIGTT
jgi:hypothetical protein